MLKQYSQSKIFLFFLIGWTLFNALQAAITGLHADEAYYWLYSRFLDWGYFDHPPMVAFFIRLGDTVFPSRFGLRLLTIITHSVSVFLLWEIVKKYAVDVKLFILLFSSVMIFHLYGFITTPDSPLLFFSVLYLYVYQRYLQEDKLKWALLLAAIIAGMLYSKYHGVLLVFFTILSNYKLLKRPSFWLIAAGALLLFTPHLYWQYQNGFPSVYYHLFDRSAKPYKFEYTSNYLLGQLLIAGPLVGWFFYKVVLQFKFNDLFLKALRFNFVGFFIFFLLSSFKNNVQPHWTLIAFPGLFILLYVYLAAKEQIPGWFLKLSVVNIILIFLVRIMFIIPLPGIKDLKPVASFFNSESWAKQIRAKAGDGYVILHGGFQDASLYDFYNRTTRGFAYDSRYYRKNQFDIWPLEDSLRNKSTYAVGQSAFASGLKQDTIQTSRGIFYGTRIDTTRIYQKLEVFTEPITDAWKSGEMRTIKLKINNPYRDTVSLSNRNTSWKCYLEYSYQQEGRMMPFVPVMSNTASLLIPPGGEAPLSVIVRAPAKAGKYKIVFSVRTEPFPGSRNSKFIPVNIK